MHIVRPPISSQCSTTTRREAWWSAAARCCSSRRAAGRWAAVPRTTSEPRRGADGSGGGCARCAKELQRSRLASSTRCPQHRLQLRGAGGCASHKRVQLLPDDLLSDGSEQDSNQREVRRGALVLPGTKRSRPLSFDNEREVVRSARRLPRRRGASEWRACAGGRRRGGGVTAAGSRGVAAITGASSSIGAAAAQRPGGGGLRAW